MIGGLGRPPWGGAPAAIGGTTADNGSKINLIMDGGGVRLSAYMTVAGASAGSIVGASLAARGAGRDRYQRTTAFGLRALDRT
jgi:hypothetical protein